MVFPPAPDLVVVRKSDNFSDNTQAEFPVNPNSENFSDWPETA
jgi:hypothetical protein